MEPQLVEAAYVWDEAGTVHPLNLRIYGAVSAIVRGLGPRRVLDVGCGSGVLCGELRRHGLDCTGLDASDVGLNAARTRFPDVRFVRGSCYDDAARTGLGTFDLVVATEVVEHLFDPKRFVDAAASHLAPAGRLILTTPDYGSYWRNLFIAATGRWDKHHAPLWDGGHIKFWSRHTLSELLSEKGFVVERWFGVRSVRVPLFNASIGCVATRRG